MYLISLAAFIIGNVFASGYPNISIPNVGNCGDDTVIVCEIATSKDGWGLLQNGNLVISKTTRINYTAKKYSFISTVKDVTFTIHDTNVFSDVGQYRCFSGFEDSSPATLALECKAKTVQGNTDETNRLLITADQLYPNNATFTTMVASQPYVLIDGSSKCEQSREYNGYYKCVWRSFFPLDGGTHSYNVTVKTITESDAFTGIVVIGLSNAAYTTRLTAGLVGGLIFLIILSCAVFIYIYKKCGTTSNIPDMSDNTNYSNQHVPVAGPSNEHERNTGDMICVNRAFDNQVSGRTVTGSQKHANT